MIFLLPPLAGVRKGNRRGKYGRAELYETRKDQLADLETDI